VRPFVSLLAALAVLACAAQAHGAVETGTYQGRIGGADVTATVTRSTCVVPASLSAPSGVKTKSGLCFAFPTGAVYDVRCTKDGAREDTQQRVLDGLRVPRSGEVDAVQKTVGRVAGVKRPSVSRTTVRLEVGRGVITGSASYRADLHNLAGHTECAGRVSFRLTRADGA
jgi:hypothetical protein